MRRKCWQNVSSRQRKQKSEKHGEMLLELQAIQMAFSAPNGPWMRSLALEDIGIPHCSLPHEDQLPEHKQSNGVMAR